ncbi:Hypothetical protein A7982_03956 [Minicystis rosea]|nr:Hypothetical protein A7982_03956 [Minicystis rosea]
MLAHLNDQVAGTEVYINPAYVVSLRPEPSDADHVSILKLRDGEAIQVLGDHRQVADKLARAERTP